jgi:hypothetical protein
MDARRDPLDVGVYPNPGPHHDQLRRDRPVWAEAVLACSFTGEHFRRLPIAALSTSTDPLHPMGTFRPSGIETNEPLAARRRHDPLSRALMVASP